MDSDVGRIRESLFVPHTAGRGGRRREENRERFRLEGDVPAREEELGDDAEDHSPEHGRVGRPGDDEAGRRLDLTG